jgi:hypothetical protein
VFVSQILFEFTVLNGASSLKGISVMPMISQNFGVIYIEKGRERMFCQLVKEYPFM